uniref:Uncharacterized protein n=1 Tax=Rhizophora mucronata TaxID=61149 RepID=A0A2P2Q3M9_RHIMU
MKRRPWVNCCYCAYF